MQFSLPAPGRLIPDGAGGFIGKYSIDTAPEGLSVAQVEGWVATALNDPGGLPAVASITFQQVPENSDPDHEINFKVVEEITFNNDPSTIGLAFADDGSILIETAEYPHKDLVTHEAIHALFGASHSPEGSISIMEPIDEPGDEGLSPTDIAEIQAYLSLRPQVPPTTYWFPGDLPYYITHWIVPEGARTRLVVTILTPAPVVLRAVYASDHAAMLAGNHQPFGTGVSALYPGVWASAWVDAPVGEFYIGIVVDATDPVDFTDLLVSLAEVQLGAAPPPAPPPAPPSPPTNLFPVRPFPAGFTVEGDQLFYDFHVTDTQFGMTKQEVIDTIMGILTDPRSWGPRLGIGIRYVEGSINEYEVMEQSECAQFGIMGGGCTLLGNPTRITFYPDALNIPTVNHETGHAMLAGHAAEGSGSIMFGGGNATGWPSDEDIAFVQAWMAAAGF